ncbi:hypothetical protein C8J57DRAFT_1531066 [Mycena rebaudengoi]|nr:hypothetical protein C8J57DRAFT_1531066 [Mycena rebaudengoi]
MLSVDGAADCKQILRGAPKSEKRHGGLGIDCLLNAAGDHFKLAQAFASSQGFVINIAPFSAYLSTPAARAVLAAVAQMLHRCVELHTVTTTFPLPAWPASPPTASYTPPAHPPRRHTVGSASYTAPELDTAQPDADLDLPPLSTRPSPPYGPPRSSASRRTRASSASCWMQRSANAARARQLGSMSLRLTTSLFLAAARAHPRLAALLRAGMGDGVFGVGAGAGAGPGVRASFASAANTRMRHLVLPALARAAAPPPRTHPLRSLDLTLPETPHITPALEAMVRVLAGVVIAARSATRTVPPPPRAKFAVVVAQMLRRYVELHTLTTMFPLPASPVSPPGSAPSYYTPPSRKHTVAAPLLHHTQLPTTTLYSNAINVDAQTLTRTRAA